MGLTWLYSENKNSESGEKSALAYDENTKIIVNLLKMKKPFSPEKSNLIQECL